MVEMWFLFSLIWSVCASVDEDGRKKIDTFLREMESQFPAKVNKNIYKYLRIGKISPSIQDTAYEYFVDVKNKSWTLWEEKLRSGWRYQPKYVTQALITFLKLSLSIGDFPVQVATVHTIYSPNHSQTIDMYTSIY